MASVVIRSILGPAALPWVRLAPSATPGSLQVLGRREIHQGRAVFAESGNLEKTFPELVEGSPNASSSTSTKPISSSASASASSSSPKPSSSSSRPLGSVAAPRPTAGHTPIVNITPPPAPAASRSPRTAGAIQFRWQPESLPHSHHPQYDILPTHTLTVVSTRNNILLTFSDRLGPVVPTITGGSGKAFKKAARANYESAHQAALKMFGQIMEFASYRSSRQEIKLRVAMKGVFGQGREAVSAAITGPEGTEIAKMMVTAEDRTPLKIGGTRARKARRL